MKQFSWDEFVARGGTVEKCPVVTRNYEAVISVTRNPVDRSTFPVLVYFANGSRQFVSPDGLLYVSGTNQDLFFAPRKVTKYAVAYRKRMFGTFSPDVTMWPLLFNSTTLIADAIAPNMLISITPIEILLDE